VRLALISDIHGNLPALEAVLSEVEQEGVDEILCLGDVAVGPQPAETLDRVRDLGCPVVLGNWDAYFIRGFPAQQSEIGRQLVEMGEWWAGHLSTQHRAFIETFTDELKRPGLIAFHGSPRSYEDFIYATTPDAELSQMLDGTRAPMLAGGHTHFAMLRQFDGALLVNPGSVGLPFAKQEAVMRISPWAEYAIVDAEDGHLSVDLRRIDFDVDSLLRLIRESGMPHADWWAGLWFRPPAGGSTTGIHELQRRTPESARGSSG
jgi:predicted phosphodiesterase